MLVLDGGTARTVPTIPNPYRQAGCQARNGHCFSCGLPVDEQLSVAERHVYWSKLFDTRRRTQAPSLASKVVAHRRSPAWCPTGIMQSEDRR
jgi:hypothetical protein